MTYIDKLFSLKDAYCNTKECRDIFFNASKEAFEFHYKNSEIYRNICKQENFSYEDLNGFDDLSKMPFIMVNAFKWYSIKSMPDEDIEFEFTSSGTSGQVSHIFWDSASKNRQSIMRSTIMKSLNLVSEKPANYAIFSYSPQVSGKKGAAYAQEQYSHFAPAKNKIFAIDADKNGNPVFDSKRVIDKLVEYSKEDIPFRGIGFPAFLYETILNMKENNIFLKFNEDSLIITAGGWKDKENKKIPKEQFDRDIYEVFGIRSENIRDIYGFVEHGVPYVTCPKGHFHVPIYSKALIRKPDTLEVLGYEKKGLLNLLSPYNLAQPSLSILSTDYAILHEGCGCGIETDYFELVGRAGLKKHEGCAITASELLNKR